MDLSLLIVFLFIGWFILGVVFGRHYKPTYPNTGTSGGNDGQTGSIYPHWWIPPFLRNDWVVEEVVAGKELHRGECSSDVYGKFMYLDRRVNKLIEVKFDSGVVTASVI